jgi:hypothetical protein
MHSSAGVHAPDPLLLPVAQPSLEDDDSPTLVLVVVVGEAVVPGSVVITVSFEGLESPVVTSDVDPVVEASGSNATTGPQPTTHTTRLEHPSRIASTIPRPPTSGSARDRWSRHPPLGRSKARTES